MDISMRKLKSFIAVTECRSFRKAAETLNLSQPTLSTNIRDLEAELGLSLFNRTTREVRPTKIGHSFYVRAKRALEEIESAAHELQEHGALRRGKVTIACIPTVASTILSEMLTVFSARFPGISLQVYDQAASLVEERVAGGEADFGIGPEPNNEADLEFNSVADERFLALVPTDHPIQGFETTLAALAEHSILTMVPGTSVRTLLEQAFDSQGLRLDPKYEAYHHYTLAGMVAAGLGVMVLPSLALGIFPQDLIRILDVADVTILRRIGVIRRRGELFSPAADIFLTTMKGIIPASSGFEIKMAPNL